MEETKRMTLEIVVSIKHQSLFSFVRLFKKKIMIVVVVVFALTFTLRVILIFSPLSFVPYSITVLTPLASGLETETTAAAPEVERSRFVESSSKSPIRVKKKMKNKQHR